MGLLDKIWGRIEDGRERRREEASAEKAYRAALQYIDWVDTDDEAPVDLRNLRDSSGMSAAERKPLEDSAFRRCAESALADDLLTEAEEHRLTQLGAILGIGEDRFNGDLRDIRDRLVIAMVNDGRMPTIDSAAAQVLLKRGETAHVTTEALLVKEVAVREYQKAGELNFRITKGMRYHSSRTPRRSVVIGTEWQRDDAGTLTVTSSRVVFSGQSKALQFEHRKLLDVGVFDGGIRLAVSNRQRASTFKVESGDVIAATIAAAAQSWLA